MDKLHRQLAALKRKQQAERDASFARLRRDIKPLARKHEKVQERLHAQHAKETAPFHAARKERDLALYAKHQQELVALLGDAPLATIHELAKDQTLGALGVFAILSRRV